MWRKISVYSLQPVEAAVIVVAPNLAVIVKEARLGAIRIATIMLFPYCFEQCGADSSTKNSNSTFEVSIFLMLQMWRKILHAYIHSLVSSWLCKKQLDLSKCIMHFPSPGKITMI